MELAHLDPARIATLYGADQEERRFVHLADVPPLLVKGLQAVEDRNFKDNIGIDFSAIARAAFANLRAGHTVQGGSTLTQQLVRNLFLSRDQTFTRKINEALMSLLLEAHYSKGRILEAYVNDVFLGQQGEQAVHGFAAASEFYFGRRLQELRPQEIALLVGMVKGPSYYDPRRAANARTGAAQPGAARSSSDTGLLNAGQLNAAQAAPLDMVEQRAIAAQPLSRRSWNWCASRSPPTSTNKRCVRRQFVGLHHARSGGAVVCRAGHHQRAQGPGQARRLRCRRRPW